MTRHPQIGQRKQGDDLASVLLQSAIANLGKTELLLDDPERMFNNRTDSRQHTIRFLLLFCEFATLGLFAGNQNGQSVFAGTH